MRNFFIFLVIAGGAYFFWQKYHLGDYGGSDNIEHPVYLESRLKMDFPGGRSLEGVILGKAYDQADCQRQADILEHDQDRWATANCRSCRLQAPECKAELPPRYAKLFSNKPTNVTYFSQNPTDRSDRPFRFIVWGVTVDESDQICDGLLERARQRGYNGSTRCIRTVRE